MNLTQLNRGLESYEFRENWLQKGDKVILEGVLTQLESLERGQAENANHEKPSGSVVAVRVKPAVPAAKEKAVAKCLEVIVLVVVDTLGLPATCGCLRPEYRTINSSLCTVCIEILKGTSRKCPA